MGFQGSIAVCVELTAVLQFCILLNELPRTQHLQCAHNPQEKLLHSLMYL